MLIEHLNRKRDTVLELLRAGEIYPRSQAAKTLNAPSHAHRAREPSAASRHRRCRPTKPARRWRGACAAETQGEVLFDAASRGRYATDASIYQIMPVGVLVPKTERDIATAIDIARDLKVPVLARGGGTSQCGQTTGAALVIDNSKHFRRVLDLDVERAHAPRSSPASCSTT